MLFSTTPVFNFYFSAEEKHPENKNSSLMCTRICPLFMLQTSTERISDVRVAPNVLIILRGRFTCKLEIYFTQRAVPRENSELMLTERCNKSKNRFEKKIFF